MSFWDNISNGLVGLQYGGGTFGSIAPAMTPEQMKAARANAFLQLGGNMLANSTQRPMQALGGAISGMAAQGPENAYRAMQMRNMEGEMSDRAKQRDREGLMWSTIDSDKDAPAWARTSPENYFKYNEASRSAASAHALYTQYAPLLQGTGAAPSIDGEVSADAPAPAALVADTIPAGYSSSTPSRARHSSPAMTISPRPPRQR